jgi:hypothetical protein
MEKLFLEATKSSPEIDFDPDIGILKISGQSYPENAFKFYERIFAWLDEYFEKTDIVTVFEVNLIYLNTSSTKCMMDIMFKIDQMAKQDKGIIINWYYTGRNRNIRECGEEFKDDMSVEFNLLEME